jgi:hypothetical protein
MTMISDEEIAQLLDELAAARPRIADLESRIVNASMAEGALAAIHELLDSGGIPRGTFADDHVRNLVALYNQRGDRIAELEAPLKKHNDRPAEVVAPALYRHYTAELVQHENTDWPDYVRAADVSRGSREPKTATLQPKNAVVSSSFRKETQRPAMTIPAITATKIVAASWLNHGGTSLSGMSHFRGGATWSF